MTMHNLMHSVTCSVTEILRHSNQQKYTIHIEYIHLKLFLNI